MAYAGYPEETGGTRYPLVSGVAAPVGSICSVTGRRSRVDDMVHPVHQTVTPQVLVRADIPRTPFLLLVVRFCTMTGAATVPRPALSFNRG